MKIRGVVTTLKMSSYVIKNVTGIFVSEPGKISHSFFGRVKACVQIFIFFLPLQIPKRTFTTMVNLSHSGFMDKLPLIGYLV